MRLHANHRTCPSSRRLICRRVLEEGWTLARAAEAAGCSERTASKWLRRYRDGRPRAVRSFLASQAKPEPALAGARANDRGAEAAVDDRGGDRRDPRHPALHRLAVAEAIGTWQAISSGPPEPPNRYERRHPGELVHVDIKKLGRISARGAGHRVLGHRGSQFAAGRGTQDTLHRLRVRARDGRRPLAPGLRRGARRPHRQLRGRLPVSRRRLVCRARCPRASGDERQLVLPPSPQRMAPPPGARRRRATSRSTTPGQPTAATSPSSNCSSTNGRTHRSTRAPTNAQVRSHPSCGATTSHDHTAPSADRHRPRG